MSNAAILRACRILGSQTNLARELGVTRAFVSHMACGHRPVPAEHCPAIERATGGAVRCEDLRGDVDWGVLRRNCAQADEAAHDERGQSAHELQEAA